MLLCVLRKRDSMICNLHLFCALHALALRPTGSAVLRMVQPQLCIYRRNLVAGDDAIAGVSGAGRVLPALGGSPSGAKQSSPAPFPSPGLSRLV
jgi:hypothetical protein